MNRLLAILLTITAITGAAPAGASAQGWRGDDYGGHEQDAARAALRERRVISLEAIIDIIGRRTPGQLLSASGPTDGGGGRLIYRILWDARGQQMQFIVDARTGEILR